MKKKYGRLGKMKRPPRWISPRHGEAVFIVVSMLRGSAGGVLSPTPQGDAGAHLLLAWSWRCP